MINTTYAARFQNNLFIIESDPQVLQLWGVPAASQEQIDQLNSEFSKALLDSNPVQAAKDLNHKFRGAHIIENDPGEVCGPGEILATVQGVMFDENGYAINLG